MNKVRVAARSALIDVLSCLRGMSNSGVFSRVAGAAVGADAFLPNMGFPMPPDTPIQHLDRICIGVVGRLQGLDRVEEQL